MSRTRSQPLPLVPGRPKPRLHDRVVEVLRTRHDGRRTRQAHVRWIGRYVRFHAHRHPSELAEADVNRFLTRLAVDGDVAASTQNQSLAAVLFLDQHVLERPLDRIEGVVRANRPKRLPVVLTRSEVRRVLDELRGVLELLKDRSSHIRELVEYLIPQWPHLLEAERRSESGNSQQHTRRITRQCTGVAVRAESKVNVTGGNPVIVVVPWMTCAQQY